MKIKLRKKMWITIAILAALVVGVRIFMQTPRFGGTARGERLERIKNSPNFRDGEFQNLHATPQFTGKGRFFSTALKFFFSRRERRRPEGEIPSVKTDFRALDPNEEYLVWFGHSSYLLHLEGKNILVDPVFSRSGSPVPFFNRSFRGTGRYTADDMPEVDFLVITHDHWDHLDYRTVMRLKGRIGRVICPLGVGAHFERWGFLPENIIEMDWDESATLERNVEVYCLPARHFSGRKFPMKQTLWASFLFKTPDFKLYIGGDSGYDTHFEEIGSRFGGVDLALLENGQYGENWKYIHLHPEETLQAGRDLRAKKVIPAHNSKFALALHPWDEPMKELARLWQEGDFELWTPKIGQVVYLKSQGQAFDHWWHHF